MPASAEPAPKSAAPLYRRVLLKISGEALMGEGRAAFDPGTLERVIGEISGIVRSGVQVGLVVGGGNLFRGISATEGATRMNRARADAIGMLATAMNALALQDTFERHGQGARVLSAMRLDPATESYSRGRALKHLEKGRVVIFAGGTGNPFFTTDTAGVLRALEIGAEVMLKATKVDGIYDADPRKNPGAQRYSRVRYSEVLEKRLEVMDATAIALAREQKLAVRVFNMTRPGSLGAVIFDENEGTLVTES